MDDIYLPAPERIADLYSLFAWIMPKSDHNYYGVTLCEVRTYDPDATLDLYSVQFGTCDPYISIQYIKNHDTIWSKDIRQYEQKPSKKRDC